MIETKQVARILYEYDTAPADSEGGEATSKRPVKPVKDWMELDEPKKEPYLKQAAYLLEKLVITEARSCA